MKDRKMLGKRKGKDFEECWVSTKEPLLAVPPTVMSKALGELLDGRDG